MADGGCAGVGGQSTHRRLDGQRVRRGRLVIQGPVRQQFHPVVGRDPGVEAAWFPVLLRLSAPHDPVRHRGVLPPAAPARRQRHQVPDDRINGHVLADEDRVDGVVSQPARRHVDGLRDGDVDDDGGATGRDATVPRLHGQLNRDALSTKIIPNFNC